MTTSDRSIVTVEDICKEVNMIDLIIKQERIKWLKAENRRFWSKQFDTKIEHWRDSIPRRLKEEGIETPDWFKTLLTSQLMRI